LCGAQLKRTWPIGPTPEVLRERWRYLLSLPPIDRAQVFGPTRDRDIACRPPNIVTGERLTALEDLGRDSPCVEPIRYAYRSFDRHWVLPDARLGDFMRPRLWRAAGPKQVFLTTMLTNVLGAGPAVVATGYVPDLDHFRGSFGARGVIPLWCDAAARQPNVNQCLLARLGIEAGSPALMAYCYALLSARGYTRRFQEELRTPGPRVPLTRRGDLFRRAVVMGDALLELHTYRRVQVGQARCLVDIGEPFPDRYSYDATNETLLIGDGVIGPISSEIWEYAVSGYRVIAGWLRHRVARRGQSPLDRIKPQRWTVDLTREILELIWLVEATLDQEHEQEVLLDEVVSGGGRELISAGEQVEDHVCWMMD
jgi:hypothetical protein